MWTNYKNFRIGDYVYAMTFKNPRDFSTVNLHDIAKVEPLQKRRMLQLLGIIYDTKNCSMYERIPNQVTRTCKYSFEIKCANLDFYSKSPNHVGAKFWNDLPKRIQDLNSKKHGKHSIICI